MLQKPAYSTLLLLALAGEAWGGLVYWAQSNSIRRVNADGSGVEDIVTGLSGAIGIEIDDASGHLYWTESSDGVDRVRRSNLDGSSSTTLVQKNLFGFNDVAVDSTNGKIYWSEGNSISRANLDGTGLDVVVGTSPRGLALDVPNNDLYWAREPDQVRRSNLDGTGAAPFLSGLSGVFGVAIDPLRGKIYWGEASAGLIRRANLDGSNVETVVSGANADLVRGIALSPSDGQLFWLTGTAGGSAALFRANLDGSNATALVTGISSPGFVAFSSSAAPEPSATLLAFVVLAAGAVGAACRRRAHSSLRLREQLARR